jgi:hypothetical protein
VESAAVIDGQALLAADRAGDNLLDPRSVVVLEPLVVERRRHGGEGMVDLDVGRHVRADTRVRGR